MKTKSDFLKNYASHPKLARLALNQGGVNWSDIVKYPQDYYAANTGNVPGMIYYSDTERFSKLNIGLILEALNDFESECGPLKKDDNYLNWLAWFAWENTMSEVMNYLEC